MNEQQNLTPQQGASPHSSEPQTEHFFHKLLYDHIGAGFLYWFFGLFATLAIFSVLSEAAPILVGISIGISQLIFVIPIGILCHNFKKPRTVKGLTLCAGLAFLLNAGCCFAIKKLDLLPVC